MSGILYAIVVLGGLGFLFGSSLSLASKIFAFETNPKVKKIREVLPGANCGACGYPGCDAYANAIVEGKAPVNACSVGGNSVAKKIAEIMGVDDVEVERKVATVLCQGDRSKAKDKYLYNGIRDCRAQNILAGGCKSCPYGCLGCGTCVDVCDYGAIQIINGVAVIDKEKCVACKACIEVCPKGIIELVPYNQEVIIKCKSNDPGKVVRGYCSVGCIGCQICVRSCPEKAITFENYLAKINYEKCTNCGICAEKCPTGSIFSSLKQVNEKAQ
ncbi:MULTISPECIES: RnfABCDGE type electron transport complex subunit B [Thermoanaerobacter]|uniref:RnfABCDGE type electron transport complex subunit B n=1 Tax=Thermoanaerobacter TaxID=1754 RepID=UPI0004903A99|nr:RnfABCDGE type electron transport complex subunit B [Thermoanaerobacter thermocopriae]